MYARTNEWYTHLSNVSEGGRSRSRNRRRDRGDRGEQGSGTAESDQLVEAHDSGAPASSEDAAN